MSAHVLGGLLIVLSAAWLVVSHIVYWRSGLGWGLASLGVGLAMVLSGMWLVLT